MTHDEIEQMPDHVLGLIQYVLDDTSLPRDQHDALSRAADLHAEMRMEARDRFAIAALPPVMARMHEDIQHLGSPTFPKNVSVHAYRIADAMLKARAGQ